MLIVLVRTIILYFTVVLTMRLMGKRQIGQLQPFELAITIMVSELASLPMQDTRIPLIHGLIPIVTLVILEGILSFVQLKSEKARTILCGKPSIIINDGKIDINQLKYQKMNINDLLEELRLKNYYNIQDIQYAILETNGQISVIPKCELATVTKIDLNIKCEKEQLPVTLILDGVINKENLKTIKKDETWLKKELHKNNISKPCDVFIATLDSKGQFFYQLK